MSSSIFRKLEKMDSPTLVNSPLTITILADLYELSICVTVPLPVILNISPDKVQFIQSLKLKSHFNSLHKIERKSKILISQRIFVTLIINPNFVSNSIPLNQRDNESYFIMNH